jgi:hypothetical protein
MKVGIWAITKHTEDSHWAYPGFLEGDDRVKYSDDADNRFATTDLNVAFRYLQLLLPSHPHLFSLEVKEKQ